MAAPHLDIPESTSTVDVSIIDTSFLISDAPSSYFFGPDIKGFETFTANAYSFFITHTDRSTGKTTRLLFDLGPPKNWEQDLAPFLVEVVHGWGSKIEIKKYVSEILEENGVSLDTIDAVVWSHPHWDHIGRPSLFPKTTDLIVGPGVKEAFAPGYPEKPTSPVLSREFADRKVTELDFSTSKLEIGGFKALDYFGDGSLYFLSAPGHAIGHMVALARTTAATGSSPSTYILMGGDSFHHGSQLRPHKYAPLPDEIELPKLHHNTKSESKSDETVTVAAETNSGSTTTTTKTNGSTGGTSRGPNIDASHLCLCPGTVFEPVHPTHRHIPVHYQAHMSAYHADPKTTPFFTISQTEDGQTLAVDIDEARKTIRNLQPFDGADNVLVIAAHDITMADVIDTYFPNGRANDWKQKGWKEKGRWRFLKDLLPAVEIAKEEEQEKEQQKQKA
ncbi:hypothetical protein KCU88_g2804, partial [Aureobasidium melanogenum]